MVPTWVPRPKYTLLTIRSSRAVREGSRAMISANWPAWEWWLRRRSARAPWMLRNDASLGQASILCRSSISLSTGLATPAKIGGGVLKRKSTSHVPCVYRSRIRSPLSARNLFLGETLRGRGGALVRPTSRDRWTFVGCLLGGARRACMQAAVEE